MCLHRGQRRVRKNHIGAMLLLSVWDKLFYGYLCFTSSCDVGIIDHRVEDTMCSSFLPTVSYVTMAISNAKLSVPKGCELRKDTSLDSFQPFSSVMGSFSPCMFVFTHRLLHVHMLLQHCPSIPHWASRLFFSFLFVVVSYYWFAFFCKETF